MFKILIFDKDKKNFESIKELIKNERFILNYCDNLIDFERYKKETNLFIFSFELLKQNDFYILKDLKNSLLYKSKIIYTLFENRDEYPLLKEAYKYGLDDDFSLKDEDFKLKQRFQKVARKHNYKRNSLYIELIDGKVTFASNGFLRLLKINAQNILSKDLSAFLLNYNSVKDLYEDLKKIEKNKEHLILEFRLKNDEVLYLETELITSDLLVEKYCRLKFIDRTEKVFYKKNSEIILNSYKDSMLVITNGEELNSISNWFFENFEYKNLEDFKSKNNCICDLFLSKNNECALKAQMNGVTWAKYLIDNKDKYHEAYIIDKDWNERVFEVKHLKTTKFGLKKINLFLFTDITKIKKLTSKNDEIEINLSNMTNAFFDVQLKLEESLKKERIEKKAKEQFFANMSHEIRTPLNGMMVSLEILKDEIKTPEEKKYVEICLNSSQHLLSIVNEILDVNKIQSGKFELDLKPIDLKNELLYLQEFYKIEIGNKNIYLEFSIDEKIPKFVNLDIKRLNQILMNLINNSIKFTEVGGINVIVKVKEESFNQVKIAFEIRDTGKGISKENLSKIFEPYAQEDSTIFSRYGGTGLGTFITKKLVDLYGGDIEIESELNKGTDISFELNFKIVNDIENEESISSELVKFNEELILVVDDNTINRELLSHLLKSMNLNILTASNGKEAAEIYENNYENIKIILMDVNMPIMNGIEATKVIREFEDISKINNIPIIALTANAMTGDDRKLIDAGMNDYLSKPVNKNKLNSLLKKYFEKIENKKGKEEIAMNDNKNLTYDIQTVAEHFGVNSETLMEILKDFFFDIKEQYSALVQELNIGNYEEAENLLHTMKGSSAELQIIKLNQEIKELEDKVKNNESIELSQLNELINLFEKEILK